MQVVSSKQLAFLFGIALPMTVAIKRNVRPVGRTITIIPRSIRIKCTGMIYWILTNRLQYAVMKTTKIRRKMTRFKLIRHVPHPRQTSHQNEQLLQTVEFLSGYSSRCATRQQRFPFRIVRATTINTRSFSRFFEQLAA